MRRKRHERIATYRFRRDPRAERGGRLPKRNDLETAVLDFSQACGLAGRMEGDGFTFPDGRVEFKGDDRIDEAILFYSGETPALTAGMFNTYLSRMHGTNVVTEYERSK